MFVKNIPLAQVRDAAVCASSLWQQARMAFIGGNPVDAKKHAEAAILEMRSNGRIVAAAVVSTQVVTAIGAVGALRNQAPSIRTTIITVMDAVTHELARLSNGKVRPTLHLGKHSHDLAVAIGTQVAVPHLMFLPIEPIPVAREFAPEGGGAGFSMPLDKALVAYQVELSLLVKTLVGGGGMEVMKEISALALAVDRRLSPSQPAIIVGAFSAWAGAVAKLSADPVEGARAELIRLVRLFEAWMVKGAQKGALTPDINLLARVLYNLTKSLTTQRARMIAEEYGLVELLDSAQPADLAVSMVNAEGYWQNAKTAWEEHINGPTQESLAAVHDAIGAYGTGLAGNASIRSMIEEISSQLRIVEPSPGVASTRIKSEISTVIAKSLDVVAKTIEDRQAGEAEAEQLKQDIGQISTARAQSTEQVAARSHSTIAIPSDALLHEIAADVTTAAASAAFGNTDAVEKTLSTAIMAASFLYGKIEGIEEFELVALKVGAIKKNDWKGLANAYKSLAHAVELFGAEPAVATTVLREIMDSIEAHEERKEALTKAAGVPMDLRGDREIFEIFEEEVAEVCATIQSLATTGLVNDGFDKVAAGHLRRAFHTIKGSARMAGLVNVGEAAWLVEQTMTRLLASGSIPRAAAHIAETAGNAILTVVQNISKRGASPVNVKAIQTLVAPFLQPELAALAKKPVPAAQPVLTAVVTPRKEPVVAKMVVKTEIPTEPLDLYVSPYLAAGVDTDVVAAFDKESRAMAAIMRAEYQALPNSGMRSEMIRSAHGLNGIAKLVGFNELHLAAHGIEAWAEHCFNHGGIYTIESFNVAGRLLSDIERLLSNYGARVHGAQLSPGVLDHLLGLCTTDTGFFEPQEELPAAVEPQEELLTMALPEAVVPEVVAQEELPVVALPEAVVPEVVPQEELPVVALPEAVVPEVVAQEELPVVALPEAVVPEVVAQEELPVVALPEAVVPEVVPQEELPVVALPDVVDRRQAVPDEVDYELFLAFKPEAEELIAEIDKELEAFTPRQGFKKINRLLHSLKGGARMAGLLSLGTALHKMEDATSSASTLSAEDVKRLIARIQGVIDEMRALMIASQAEEFGKPIEVVPTEVLARDATPIKPVDGFVKVGTSRLDALQVMMGQMRIVQDRIRRQSRAGESLLEESLDPLNRLRALWNQISTETESQMESGVQGNADLPGFDALEMDRFSKMHELTRRMREAAADIEEIFGRIQLTLESTRDSSEQERDLSEEIDQTVSKIGRTHILAFQGRLRATGRQAALDTGKQVMVDVDGDARIDRSVMDMLIPAVEHMVRNSIAHGIETTERRLGMGKGAEGHITISTRNEGRYASIVVSDDGAGVDFDRVKAKAMSKGMLQLNHEPSESELIAALFSPGFSTAEIVNETAGRGVGLDVVRDTIQRLGGRVTLSSVKGKGSSFTIRVPLSSAHVSGLLMEANGKPYIIPSALIKAVETVTGSSLATALNDDRRNLELPDGTNSKLILLDHSVGNLSKSQFPGFGMVALPHDSPYAVYADSVEYVDNAPVFPFEDCIPIGSGVIGHSILSDGRVAVVLNLKDVIARGQSQMASEFMSATLQQDRKVLVMVVDDSITVRHLSKKFLLKNGFDVIDAKDGADAIEKLAAALTLPDVILMDIEMPVMDGFAACTAIKATDRLRRIPLAFISSRNAAKHRDYAESIGASAFFGKPYNETDVLAFIRQKTKGPQSGNDEFFQTDEPLEVA